MTPSSKIIHVITRLDWGGSAQNTMLTVLGLDRSRFEPLVVAGRAGRWNDQGGDEAAAVNFRRLREAGLRYCELSSLRRPLNPWWDLLAYLHLVRLFRRERPALVHTHTSKAGVLGRLAAWTVGATPVVHTPHGHVFYGHFGRGASRIFLEIEKRLARRTAHLIALTEAEREEHLARGVGRADRFTVAPSGIDLERFRQAGQAGTDAERTSRRPPGFDCPADALVVGSVGWLTPVKGHRFLIEAVAHLKPRFPSLHLVIVGSGALREDFLALAGRLGLREAVHLPGARPDIAACLAAMDIFVLPSLNEGMGRALIEAMAAGRPVVASRVGGIPSIVDDRRTGLLVPPGEPEALAAALEMLLQRPDWRRELGTAASRSIGERYGAPAMVKTIESVYDRVLAESFSDA